MINSHEPAMAALFTLLQNAVKVNFTGNGTPASATITNLSGTRGFFQGLPVFGPGVPQGAVIDSFDPVGLTVTLSAPLTAPSTAGAFSTGFLTTGRRVQFWTDVAAQPALFLRHTAAEDDYPGTVLQRTSIEAEIWIYAKNTDPNAPADTLLNNLITAVRTVLAADVMGNPVNLSGLARFCRIEGRSDYDPGDIDAQAKAVIPVKILLP